MTTATDAERWNTDGKWPDLSMSQRFAFFGKLIVAICTAGFVYPNILS